MSKISNAQKQRRHQKHRGQQPPKSIRKIRVLGYDGANSTKLELVRMPFAPRLRTKRGNRLTRQHRRNRSRFYRMQD